MGEANVLFTIGPLQITSVITTSWVIMLVLTLFAILATRNLKEVPGPLQNMAEMAVEGLQNYFSGLLGKENGRKYFPVFATFFIFIVVCNYSGQLPGAGHLTGFAVPTACLSVTAALAIIAFGTTHTIGIRERGLKSYLKILITPFALMLPLNLIEQMVRPFSLSLRLFGNLYGEEQVLEEFYHLFPILLPLVMNVLSLLFCFVQALVFTMLVSIYTAEGLGEEE
jgi:F-type H+-transporting ATPase subunit a